MKPTLKTRLIAAAKIASMVLLILFVVAIMIFAVAQARSVSWTGFGDYTTPTGEFIRGKTVWDWMQLLVIPLSLLIGGYLLNRSEREIERQRVEERAKVEQKRAEERANLEREIATDRQQEAALQAYLDRMADLLLKEKLLTSENPEVRNVARIRTLSALEGLDPRRRTMVFNFLYQSGLLDYQKIPGLFSATPKLGVSGANFAGAVLRSAFVEQVFLDSVDLSGADLSGSVFNDAWLFRAKFIGAKLNRTDLRNAILSEANLNGASLEKALLAGANLVSASLIGTNLRRANLKGANLQSANLTDADLTGAELDSADFMHAIMPDGTIHD